MTKKRVGILISGRGSNMLSLIKACDDPEYPAQIVVVVSNRPGAPGLQTAQELGIKTITIDHKSYPDRKSFEHQLDNALVDNNVELICNAGFMRLLTPDFVENWRDRQLNIHPSLLPSFKGLHTHRRVLESGVKITGCTVHIVRTDMDAGPIIAQAAVPVEKNDNEELLSARVLDAEHKLYPHALRMIASGEAYVLDEKVEFKDKVGFNNKTSDRIFSPSLREDQT